MIRWNIGSCDRHFEGYLAVDIRQPADILADLSLDWPADDSTVDEIRAWDIIEHLPDKIHTMNEAWRVLRLGGLLDIEVPTTDGRGAWQDPEHVSYWNRNSFLYYTDGDPHRERFGATADKPGNGVMARFRVESEAHKRYPDGVVKLRIVLAAVK